MTKQSDEFASDEVLLSEDDILVARNLTVEYSTRKAKVLAVDNLTFALRRGETLGLVGESGCGKSTTGRSLVQLPRPTSGTVTLDNLTLSALSERELRPIRRRIQLLFQDPISSLNPRRTAVDLVAEPLRIAKVKDAKERAMEVLLQVGVDSRMAQRRPHQLSGGQCQRISIARAVAQRPEVLVCDEPVSALDVSVQAQVLNLLEQTKAERKLSMIFISHDLAVVKSISDRVAVMYLGRICEVAPSVDLYTTPRHHYTDLLLRSIPKPVTLQPSPSVSEPAVDVDEGLMLAGRSTGEKQAGCLFADRCPAATSECSSIRPSLREVAAGHMVACHNPIPARSARPSHTT